jgi:hypothetical protein
VAIQTPAEQSASMFEQAVDKLKSGDETGAVTLLRRAISLDPENEQAQSELDRIVRERADTPGNSNGTPADDDDPGDEVDPDDDDEFDQAVADLTILLPAAVEG